MTADTNAFDLAFSGELQPGQDPEKVKTRVADYFEIQDPSVLDALFSGQHIYLFKDLDRRSASEHFHGLSKLGCEVTLVNANDRRGAGGKATFFLNRDDTSPARIVQAVSYTHLTLPTIQL